MKKLKQKLTKMNTDVSSDVVSDIFSLIYNTVCAITGMIYINRDHLTQSISGSKFVKNISKFNSEEREREDKRKGE